MISEFLDPMVGKYLNWLINPIASLMSKLVGEKWGRDAAYVTVILVVAAVAITLYKKYKK